MFDSKVIRLEQVSEQRKEGLGIPLRRVSMEVPEQPALAKNKNPLGVGQRVVEMMAGDQDTRRPSSGVLSSEPAEERGHARVRRGQELVEQ